MCKKIFTALLVVALIVTVVGVGIHILHRDALAQQITVTVFLEDEGGNPVVAVDLFASLLNEQDGEEFSAFMTEDPPGTYTLEWFDELNEVVKWKVAILNDDVTAVDPPDNPHKEGISVNQFTWEVLDNRP